MNLIKNKYKCKIGYSGHENSISPSVVAAVLGATSIERHITLDRSLYGTDQAASIEEPGLRSLVNQLRKLNFILGDGIKKFTDISVGLKKTVSWFKHNKNKLNF